jgi:hypothetical protein
MKNIKDNNIITNVQVFTKVEPMSIVKPIKLNLLAYNNRNFTLLSGYDPHYILGKFTYSSLNILPYVTLKNSCTFGLSRTYTYLSNPISSSFFVTRGMKKVIDKAVESAPKLAETVSTKPINAYPQNPSGLTSLPISEITKASPSNKSVDDGTRSVPVPKVHPLQAQHNAAQRLFDNAKDKSKVDYYIPPPPPPPLLPKSNQSSKPINFKGEIESGASRLKGEVNQNSKTTQTDQDTSFLGKVWSYFSHTHSVSSEVSNPLSSKESNPPLPPLPPPLPPLSPKTPKSNSLSFTEQIKKKGSQEVNLKPSKFKYTIPENTKINQDLVSSDISNNDLLLEMKARGLLKENTDKKEVTFKTEDGKDITIKQTPFKFSPLGQGYIEQHNYKTFIANTPEAKENEDIEFKIAIIPPENETFFPSAKQKHLVVSCKKNSDECLIIGYFTSKNTGDFISKKQFKVYQDEKRGIVNNNKPKDQRFKPFENAEAIPKNNLTFIQEGNDYIRATAIEYFENLRTTLKLLPSSIFNPNEFTKDDAISLCLAFDKNVTQNKAQPKSKEQTKLDQENQTKQAKINEAKKLKATSMSQEETTTNETNETKTS